MKSKFSPILCPQCSAQRALWKVLGRLLCSCCGWRAPGYPGARLVPGPNDPDAFPYHRIHHTPMPEPYVFEILLRP